MKPIFSVKRLGPKGADSHKHLFCIQAEGQPDLVRSNESPKFALLNGASGSDPSVIRKVMEKVSIALNQVMQDYFDGKFHEDERIEEDLAHDAQAAELNHSE